MIDHDGKDNQSDDDDNSDNAKEFVIDRASERRLAEEQRYRLMSEIAQSAQDASDELRLINDNIDSLTHEVHGTKEAIKSRTDVLRKYLDNNKNQDRNHNNKA